MTQYTVTQLKAMAFDAGRQIQLLRQKEAEVLRELVDRDALTVAVDLTPDEEEKADV